MTYQVLARKYRPARFQDVVGQEHVTETLLHAFEQKRVGHAYLFSGPRGCGKTTTARILSAALNCEQGDGGTPCRTCRNCSEIAASRSLDVLEIDGASSRGIDEIRDLREVAKYPPLNSRYKVFVIDEVHMLTREAFNALLKTLEEPPPHLKFVFATTEPGKVPPTILSRCQRHDFHRLTIPEMTFEMKGILAREGISCDDRSLHLIATTADGSMRDALSLLDQTIAFCGSEIRFENAAKMMGVAPADLFFNLTDGLRLKDAKRVLGVVDDVRNRGIALSDFLSGLNQHLLHLLMTSVEGGSEALELTDDLKARYVAETAQWNSRDLLRMSDLVAEAQIQLKSAAQPFVLVESAMFKLLALDSAVSLAEVLKRLPSPQREPRLQPVPPMAQTLRFGETDRPPAAPLRVESQPSDHPQLVPTAMSGSSENSELFGRIVAEWDALIAKVNQNGHSLSTFLSHGTPRELNGTRLTIGIPITYRFHLNILKANASKIETTFAEALGAELRLEFVESNELEPAAGKALEENPTAKRVMELFGGRIGS